MSQRIMSYYDDSKGYAMSDGQPGHRTRQPGDHPDDLNRSHDLRHKVAKGLLYMNGWLTDQAMAAFQAAALYLSPDDAETTTNLGVGYFFRGDLERAVRLFEQALALDPAFIPARYHLGVAYLYQGRCEAAIAALEAVVAAQPDYPQAAANLGVAYNTAGQPGRAMAIFESLLQQQPDNPSVVLNLGYACQDAGDAERAGDCFRRVMAMTAPDTPYARKAQQALSDMQSTVV
jgi:tetratricopeptide (TPR) repeat protein